MFEIAVEILDVLMIELIVGTNMEIFCFFSECV